MRQKISKQTKMREVLQKKLHQLEEQKADVEVERDTLKVQIPALEKGTPPWSENGCHWALSTTQYYNTLFTKESQFLYNFFFYICTI